MSDDEHEDEKPFAVERAKSGRAKCKKCKCSIEKDEVRIAKLMANPFGEGKMKSWHHVNCIFEVFTKQRASTKRIENPEEDISGWNSLCDEDKNMIIEKIQEFEDAEPFKAAKAKANLKSPKGNQIQTSKKKLMDDVEATSSTVLDIGKKKTIDHVKESKKGFTKDDMFSEFQRICDELSSCSAYLEKTAIVKKMFTKGSDKDGFKGDIILWCRLLLPGAVKRIYNLQSKALIKLFARLLHQNENSMLEDLEQGDVAMTIKSFYEKSLVVRPCAVSDLTLHEVDEFLEKLSTLTKEEEQIYHFKSILRRCTADDLKMIIRLIKHDLRINAGPKHILGAVHDDAYTAFQVSRDLPAIIRRCLNFPASVSPASSPLSSSPIAKSPKTGKVASLALMTPVLPMLAEPCTSVDMAMEKCPNGMLSEVKYDGERVQVHKMGSNFLYFSRSLKPVLAHKVNFLKEFIPKAFPQGDDLILDAEILLIDTKTGMPLPFGSLGVHKQSEFKDANVCLFIFDIIFYNGEPLLNRTMMERRTLLEEKMTPIPNRIMLSETQKLDDPQKLAEMIVKVFKLQLEGLVLKPVDSKYEPGKRHWLKIKKDYLFKGAMADSADLVVLGAWYGTGQKGGIMSVFLMGCYDPDHDVWVTVTKVHTGHTDAVLTELQTSLDMVKIGKDPNLVPKWLKANKPMIPDFVARDPKKQPVWEITGAEFTNQGVHTAEGISIRFPRVTRIRSDKDWETATNLPELRSLFKKSADSIDYSLILGSVTQKRPIADDDKNKSPKKRGRTGSGKPSTSEVDNENSNDDINSNYNPDLKIQNHINRFNESEKSKNKKSSPKKSPEKLPNKLITQCFNKTPLVENETEMDSNTSIEPKKEKQAEFYSFIGTDYIEYSAAGSPLNWIEGRKPPKQLPKNAKPISERDEAKMRSRCLLYNEPIYLNRDLHHEKRKIIQRTLKTLGATVLSEAELSKAAYVIHGCDRIPATVLLEPSKIPKSARHVTESWVDATVSQCKVQNAVNHAVTLSGVYCSCPCPHQG